MTYVMPDPDALDYAFKWLRYEDWDWLNTKGESGWLNMVEAFQNHYSTYLAMRDGQ